MSELKYYGVTRNEDGTYYLGHNGAYVEKRADRLMMTEEIARSYKELFPDSPMHITSDRQQNVLSLLHLMRSMINDIPDGQWQDGPEELLEYIREEKPSPFAEAFWIDAEQELLANQARWM